MADHDAIDAVDELAAQNERFEERKQGYQQQAERGRVSPLVRQVLRPQARYLVGLVHMVRQRAERAMDHHAPQVLDRAFAHHHRVVHRRILEPGQAAAVQTYRVMKRSPAMTGLLERIQWQDRQGEGGDGRIAGGKARADLGTEFGRDLLVGIQVQQPVVAAQALGEHLLWSIATPCVVYDARTERFAQCHGVVVAATVDNDDLVDPVPDTLDGQRDPVGLVPGDDEYRDLQCWHGAQRFA